MKHIHNFNKKLALLLVFVLGINITACGLKTTESTVSANVVYQSDNQIAQVQNVNLNDYSLVQVAMFSRHNIRAPLSGKGSLMEQVTPYPWAKWTADAGELTTLGGAQEIAMGQYFEKYLVDKGLFMHNWMPKENQVRFYSNSFQRTIATAQYFSTGMLPAANVDVEYHCNFGEMDPVFFPGLETCTKEQEMQYQADVDELFGGRGLNGSIEEISDNIALIEEVVDFKDSKYAKENGITSIPLDDSKVVFEAGQEPKITGGFSIAASLADTLIMQYYEEADDTKAGFGRKLTMEEWQKIADVCSVSQTLKFGSKTLSKKFANKLLKELKSELNNSNRVFTYICGHDSNVEPILLSLGVEDYKATGNISSTTPIGCKIVFEKYINHDKKEFVKMYLVYQTSEKLRNNERVNLENPPVWLELSLKGVQRNRDGFYSMDDVNKRFDEAIGQ